MTHVSQPLAVGCMYPFPLHRARVGWGSHNLPGISRLRDSVDREQVLQRGSSELWAANAHSKWGCVWWPGVGHHQHLLQREKVVLREVRTVLASELLLCLECFAPPSHLPVPTGQVNFKCHTSRKPAPPQVSLALPDTLIPSHACPWRHLPNL